MVCLFKTLCMKKPGTFPSMGSCPQVVWSFSIWGTWFNHINYTSWPHGGIHSSYYFPISWVTFFFLSSWICFLTFNLSASLCFRWFSFRKYRLRFRFLLLSGFQQEKNERHHITYHDHITILPRIPELLQHFNFVLAIITAGFWQTYIYIICP